MVRQVRVEIVDRIVDRQVRVVVGKDGKTGKSGNS